MVDFDEEIVIIHFLALKGIVRGTLDWIGMSCSSAGNEVSHAAVLVPLVIMHMSGENHEANASVRLAALKHLGQ
jgi:hypothetical protein